MVLGEGEIRDASRSSLSCEKPCCHLLAGKGGTFLVPDTGAGQAADVESGIQDGFVADNMLGSPSCRQCLESRIGWGRPGMNVDPGETRREGGRGLQEEPWASGVETR